MSTLSYKLFIIKYFKQFVKIAFNITALTNVGLSIHSDSILNQQKSAGQLHFEVNFHHASQSEATLNLIRVRHFDASSVLQEDGGRALLIFTVLKLKYRSSSPSVTEDKVCCCRDTARKLEMTAQIRRYAILRKLRTYEYSSIATLTCFNNVKGLVHVLRS